MTALSRRALLAGAAALCLASARLAAAAPADARAPEAVVGDFHADLLAVMKAARELSVKDRYGRLEPALARTFNAAAMTQIVSGRYWRDADAAAQARAAAAFHRFSTATYAVQFDGFSGQAFETLANRPGPQDTALVVTRIAKDGATEADLTYVLKRAGEAAGGGTPPWRVIDVLLDNSISQLAVRRSEYRQTLKKGGLDALATELNAAADRLLAG
ncbi:MAG: ABC transporter substrate-binding protein [Hyphomicrobiales bacterium]|nr:ABC transporter substrate-binding protein [Hyphomicrobiales bacterium]